MQVFEPHNKYSGAAWRHTWLSMRAGCLAYFECAGRSQHGHVGCVGAAGLQFPLHPVFVSMPLLAPGYDHAQWLFLQHLEEQACRVVCALSAQQDSSDVMVEGWAIVAMHG